MYIAFWQLHSPLYLEKSRVIWDSVAAQQILAELVERSWRGAQPNQADCVREELTGLLISFVSQTQSQGATDSECCLLNIAVKSSTEQSREKCCGGVPGDQHQDVL